MVNIVYQYSEMNHVGRCVKIPNICMLSFHPPKKSSLQGITLQAAELCTSLTNF